jgi:hypothetical protein
LAITNGYFDMVVYLIDRGADVNRPSLIGERPLHLAIRKGYIKIFRYLLTHGSILESMNYNNVVDLAIRHKSYIVITDLCRLGCVFNSYNMLVAIVENDNEAIKILLDNATSDHLINGAIEHAITNLKYDCLIYILDRKDDNIDWNECLATAFKVKSGHIIMEVIKRCPKEIIQYWHLNHSVCSQYCTSDQMDCYSTSRSNQI